MKWNDTISKEGFRIYNRLLWLKKIEYQFSGFFFLKIKNLTETLVLSSDLSANNIFDIFLNLRCWLC